MSSDAEAHPIREFVPILVEDTARDTLRVLPATSRDHRRLIVGSAARPRGSRTRQPWSVMIDG